LYSVLYNIHFSNLYTSNQIICFEMFVVNGVGAILRSIRLLTQLRWRIIGIFEVVSSVGAG